LTTTESFTDFDLEFEWRVGPGAVGDVFYHVGGVDFESRKLLHRLHLCDPAAKQGSSDVNRTGANYSIVLQSHDASRPVGQWNTARLVVRGSKRENWINGEKVCDYDISDADLRRKAGPEYGRLTSGAIALSAYTGEVAFRNLRLSASGQPSVAVPPTARPSSSAAAAKDAPFVNSLGMKFVPVPITGGPTAGQRVMFSVWETRVQDYEAFVKDTKRNWPKVSEVEQGPTHPAAGVDWDGAMAFCAWLTQRELAAGRIAPGDRYRLPSDHEWSCAVGIGDREDAAKPPADKHGALEGAYPWGSAWPPPAGSGNFSSEELRELIASRKHASVQGELKDYRDGFATLAPVGSFAANALGLHDLGGNAWEWCEDWFDSAKRVMRGGSYSWGRSSNSEDLLSSHRRAVAPSDTLRYGFRCVLAGIPEPGGAVIDTPPVVPSNSKPAIPIPGAASVGTRDLFNGRDATGWTGPKGAAAASTWTIHSGVFSARQRTTLWSEESFGDFELEIEWKMGPKGNGGIFYHVPGANELEAGEMQLADPANAGANKSGALYAVLPERRDASKPVGEWNTAKIVARGPQREHWINGELVVSYDVSSAEFRSRLAASTVRTKPTFAADRGKFVLQSNAGEVFYRNARIRVPGSGGAPAAVAPFGGVAMPATTGDKSVAAPSDPRLARIEAAFKAEYAAKVQGTYDTNVAALNTGYAGAIGRARTAAQTKGVLAEVTAMDDELKRIQANQGVPAADEPNAPAELVRLRQTYRDTLGKHAAARDQAARPVLVAHLKSLDAYVVELTRANKLEDALRVQALRDSVAAPKK